MSSRALLVEKVYGSAILILSGCDRKEAERKSREWFIKEGKDVSEMDFTIEPDTRALTFNNGRNFVIWLREAFDVRSLAHEAVHAGMFLMKSIGHDVNQGDEPLAYYCDWVVGEAMERL